MMGQKDGSLYMANGVLLTILFFASHVVSYGAGMWHLWTLRSESLSPRPSASPHSSQFAPQKPASGFKKGFGFGNFGVTRKDTGA